MTNEVTTRYASGLANLISFWLTIHISVEMLPALWI